MTTFEQIKKLSDERKISLKDLANKLGFGENYFYNMKNAKSSPSSEVLLKVADYFHVTVDYLLGREGDYKFDDYPFKVSVTQKTDGSFNINCQPVQDTPGTLLQTIRNVKSDLEKSYNQIPDFNTEDSVWTVNHVEEQFIEELVKNNVWVVRLKQNEKQPIDLADLVDDSKVDWDEWVSFDGKPLTDEVKTAMKLILGKRLED